MRDSTEISMNLVTRAFYLGLEKTFTHKYIQNNIFQTIAKNYDSNRLGPGVIRR